MDADDIPVKQLITCLAVQSQKSEDDIANFIRKTHNFVRKSKSTYNDPFVIPHHFVIPKTLYNPTPNTLSNPLLSHFVIHQPDTLCKPILPDFATLGFYTLKLPSIVFWNNVAFINNVFFENPDHKELVL